MRSTRTRTLEAGSNARTPTLPIPLLPSPSSPLITLEQGGPSPRGRQLVRGRGREGCGARRGHVELFVLSLVRTDLAFILHRKLKAGLGHLTPLTHGAGLGIQAMQPVPYATHTARACGGQANAYLPGARSDPTL